LAEVSNAATSAVSAAADAAATPARLPFTAKILAVTSALPHAHIIVLVVVFAMPVIVFAVMRLVRKMATVPGFPTHHTFAAPTHAVSISATAASARPCIGANRKCSDNRGSRNGDGASSEHAHVDQMSARRCLLANQNAGLG
jgi:hypothetical protein